MSNNYAEIIDALSSSELDLRLIAIEVAKSNPSAFMKAKKLVDEKRSRPEWTAECKKMKDSGLKVEAIKFWREKTGAGLREAKDAVDAL